MNNILNKLSLIAIIIILASCTKTLEYKGEVLDPLLVVNCNGTVGDTLYCSVSKTDFFLNKDKTYKIDDATVRYKVNNGEWSNMRFAQYSGYYGHIDSMFISDYMIKANDLIEIEVSHPDFTTARASQLAPSPAKIELIEMEDLGESYKVTVELHPYEGNKDAAGFYSFSASHKSTYIDTIYSGYNEDNEYIDTIIIDTVDLYGALFESNDPLIIASNQYSFSGSYDPSTNRYGNIYIPISELKTLHNLTIEIPKVDYYGNQIDINETSLKRLDIYYTVLSDELYKYLYSYSKYEETGMGGIFSEKVQIYNNIDGGVGHFSISAMETLTIGDRCKAPICCLIF